MGEFKVPHFDAKGEAEQLFTDRGVPTTFLLTSFYWDNLIYFGSGPQRMPDGSLALVFPLDDAKLPGIAAEDIGRAAYGVFKAGDRFIGETVGIAGGHLSGQEMADAMSRALGEDIGYASVPPEVYRGFDFDGADDLGNMFQFKRDFEADFRRPRDVDRTRRLNPQLQSFDDWLSRHGSQIPIPD
ncbi:MAG: NmrA family NAD(P)-binding protein, partial [Rhodothermales bacterium]|nr:NmrA family NAD(P)-binding protein [Rhodothermales bacterium]